MSRRPALRPSDLVNALAALKQAGVEPSSLEVLPDGTHRWHFTKPAASDDNDLDKELAEFDARHGHG
ncbi:hypothetical protein [Mesorhizobium sp. B2-1-3A]|uniref:hypothetical protein n=1 Tax=Mesorhizobium sp. B2-1-3A TaxID=2589971 RepID=UPI001129C313|nr:hypothetical protein [Mesorhizobium sp. B2-1-3A]TPM92689.1 hypothetical protein FJ977_27790 [Mesorhizobium sp. B2-1-3A]